MDKYLTLTLLSPSISIIKQDNVSFPVLGKNNIFDRAKKESNEANKIMLLRVQKENKRFEVISKMFNSKVIEEKKRTFKMIQTLHLIKRDDTFKNSIEKVEVINKELGKIKNKIISPIDLAIKRNKANKSNKSCLKKLVFNKGNKTQNINPSSIKVSLTERRNKINDRDIFVNKRQRVIDLLNYFENEKKLSRNKINLTENYSHYNSYIAETNTRSRIQYKKLFLLKENELSEIN